MSAPMTYNCAECGVDMTDGYNRYSDGACRWCPRPPSSALPSRADSDGDSVDRGGALDIERLLKAARRNPQELVPGAWVTWVGKLLPSKRHLAGRRPETSENIGRVSKVKGPSTDGFGRRRGPPRYRVVWYRRSGTDHPKGWRETNGQEELRALHPLEALTLLMTDAVEEALNE